MRFTDRLTLDGELRRTSDGYAATSARVARAGNVQVYLGSEVGVADKTVVRVYRPEAEVFKRDAIKSYAGVPVTVDHPTVSVTAENWKDLAVGEVGEDVLRDGEFVRVPIMLRDINAISAIEGGKRELSMGYDANVTLADGTTPSGEIFDAVMSGFKMNHVAIVDKARGGSELRIGDGAKWGAAPITDVSKTGVPDMADTPALKTITFDGIAIQVTDQGAQAIEKMQKLLSDAASASAKLVADHAAAIAAKDAELAKKDAAIDDLKKKVVSDAELDNRVQDRAALVGIAKIIVPTLKTDGVSDADIRKAVVIAKLGDAAVKDKPAAYIDARFDILAEDAGKTVDPLRTGIMQTQPVGDANDAAKKAHDAYVARTTNAWKGETKAA